MFKSGEIDSKLLDSIFQNINRNNAGNNIKTFVNETSISILKGFRYPNRIEMVSGELPIIVSDSVPGNVFHPLNCEKFIPSQLSFIMKSWNQISVYHENIRTKEEIINELYKVAENSLFIPIAYRRDVNIDYFFLCNQNDMIRKLFEKKLQITVKGCIMPLLVKLDVATITDGHVKANKSMLAVIKRKLNESTGGLKVLDFSNIKKERELSEAYITFKNKPVLHMFLDQLNAIRDIKLSVHVMKFDENELQTLEPFSKRLHEFNNLRIMSLSKNSLEEIDELRHLKNLSLEEIYIDNNFGYTNTKALLNKFESKIQEMLPMLKKVNGVLLSSHALTEKHIVEKKLFSQEISNVSDGILITQNNIKNYRNRFDRILNDQCWTMIILNHNRRFTTEQILDELISNLLNDKFFYPCYLKRIGDRDEFFVCKNSDALKTLFQSGLKIQMKRSSFTVDVSMRLNVADFNENEIDWSSKITSAVSSRVKENILDLDNFPKSLEFQKMILPMNSRTIELILAQTKKINPNITRIDAENCNITNCDGFQHLFSFSKLTTLNLRNNNISSLEGFQQCPTIKNILLDGNPICSQSAAEYVAHICENLPSIENIDNHQIQQDVKLVSFQNYLVASEAYPIVDAFVTHYFGLFDSFDRNKLLSTVYDEKSVFTLSCHYVIDDNYPINLTQIYPRYQAILQTSRNLAKISDMSLIAANVFVGRNIQKFFNVLLQTKHNLCTFTIDVPIYDPKNGLILIIIGGLFEEICESESSNLPFGFSRSFLLKIIDSEITIINDQLLIHHPTAMNFEAIARNIQPAKEKEIAITCNDLMPNESQENAVKLIMLQDMTQCTKEYCLKLLQDNLWDFKVAVTCFTTYMDANQVPDNAFVK